MIIKPLIRANVFLTAHPLGCRQFVKHQIDEARRLPPFHGPSNVLIIGGSSGFGLASRIALAVSGKSNTINVSYESGPKGERTGTAGWWNNLAFQEAMRPSSTSHKDFIGDAFSSLMKNQVIEYLKQTGIKLDLIVYSLAAGACTNETTGELVRSHIKTIGEPVSGKTIDISTMSIKQITVDGATNMEIDDTVFVMGGRDWKSWIEQLDQANVLNQNVKTVAYTYVGGDITTRIYRFGTIGRAKVDLENTGHALHTFLASKYNGEALISASKAVVTKASVFIPQMPIYVAYLFDVMKRHGVHETTLEHKYRLFKDMIYGLNRVIDDEGRLRLDQYEMAPSIQDEVNKLMMNIDDVSLLNNQATKQFVDEFYQIHGFRIDGIDYGLDVNLEEISFNSKLE